MSEIFTTILKALSEVAKDPTVRKEAIKTGFKIGGAAAIGGGGLWVWNQKRKITKKDDAEKEKRRESSKDRDRQKDLLYAQALEDIKTKGMQDRMNLRGNTSKGTSGTTSTQDLPSVVAPGLKEKPASQTLQRITLVPDLIRSNENSIIYGEAKIGKTFLGVQLAADLARGGKSTLFPDKEFSVIPHCVVYYNYEQDSERIEENFKSLPFGLDNLVMIDQDVCGEHLNSIELLLNDIKLRVNSYPIKTQIVVFIDNLNRVVENSSAKLAVKQFTDGLEEQSRLARQRGRVLTNIILAHANRKGELQGTISLLERAKCIIAFEKIDREHRRLRLIKSNNNFSEEPYILRWSKYPGFGNSCLVFDKMESETPTPRPSSTTPSSKERKDSNPEQSDAKSTPTIKKDVRCKFTDEDIREIIRRKNAGERIEDIAKEKGTSMKTLYKWINKYREEHPGE